MICIEKTVLLIYFSNCCLVVLQTEGEQYTLVSILLAPPEIKLLYRLYCLCVVDTAVLWSMDGKALFHSVMLKELLYQQLNGPNNLGLLW